jgi:hypothetical protein
MVRIGGSVLVVLLAVAGCTSSPAAAPASTPGVTTQPATPATTTTAPAPVFTTEGVAPYRVGAELSALEAAGVLADVTKVPWPCDNETLAWGTGLHQSVALHFIDGRLHSVSSRSASIATASGARIGDTLATLQSIYGSAGEKLTRDDVAAFLVTEPSGRGILFHLDKANKVTAMDANSSNASDIKVSFDYVLDC